MPIPLKGLKSIRTLAGRVNRLTVPYRAQMQITCLEIEKARRLTERRSASRRVAEIDARLEDIEAEKEVIQQALADRKEAKRVDLPKAGLHPKPRHGVGAFRIKY